MSAEIRRTMEVCCYRVRSNPNATGIQPLLSIYIRESAVA